MTVINFAAERMRRRPWADLGYDSLQALRLMNAARGDVRAVEAITAELARRKAADARLGAA